MVNTITLDNFIWCGRMNPNNLDEASQQKMLQLFELTDKIEPVGDDNRVEFWIKQPRCTFEEYCCNYEYEEASREEIRNAYYSEWPDPYEWYHFLSLHHEDTGREFKGIFLNGEYVLCLNDINAKGYPIDATDILDWLIEKTKEVIEELKAGTYNEKIKKELPYKHRFGKISRKDYWDIYPEEREEYRNQLSEEDINLFVSLAKEEGKGIDPDICYSDMTARQYFEACAVGIEAVGRGKKRYWRFTETEEEKERYGGVTPREIYCGSADGRDDGLTRVPLDDPEAFALWIDRKEPYYEFNGHHPFEVTPSGLIFAVHYPYKWEGGNLIVNRKKYFFSLSGEELYHSIDAVKFYLALVKKGIKVSLFKHAEMAKRFTKTDDIEIFPIRHLSHYGDKNLDAVNLIDGDKPEEVIKKAVWEDEKIVRLKS